MTLPLLETLVANPGLYVGTGTEHDGTVSVARIVVSVLPSRAAVTLDYEARHTANPDQWAEHALLGRTYDGRLLLVSSHRVEPAMVLLREDEPGFFVNDPAAYRFPMGIRCEVPEEGTLRYDWWYSMPGNPLERHDDTVVKLVR